MANEITDKCYVYNERHGLCEPVSKWFDEDKEPFTYLTPIGNPLIGSQGFAYKKDCRPATENDKLVYLVDNGWRKDSCNDLTFKDSRFYLSKTDAVWYPYDARQSAVVSYAFHSIDLNNLTAAIAACNILNSKP